MILIGKFELAQASQVHARLGANQTFTELLVAHFHRKETDGLVLIHGDVAGPLVPEPSEIRRISDNRIDHERKLTVVRANLAAPGTALEIEIFGERYAATVQPEQALWDPDNERLRC